MTEAASAPEVTLPRLVPALLSFRCRRCRHLHIPCFVRVVRCSGDGKLRDRRSQLVTHDLGITGKMLAILAFLLATAVTAGLINLVRELGRAPFPGCSRSKPRFWRHSRSCC